MDRVEAAHPGAFHGLAAGVEQLAGQGLAGVHGQVAPHRGAVRLRLDTGDGVEVEERPGRGEPQPAGLPLGERLAGQVVARLPAGDDRAEARQAGDAGVAVGTGVVQPQEQPLPGPGLAARALFSSWGTTSELRISMRVQVSKMACRENMRVTFLPGKAKTEERALPDSWCLYSIKESPDVCETAILGVVLAISPLASFALCSHYSRVGNR